MFSLQDYAMLLSTLEEYVHMLINTCTDENIRWFILGFIVLFLLIVFLAIKKAKNNKNENLKRFVWLIISIFFYLDTLARLLVIVLQNIINFT